MPERSHRDPADSARASSLPDFAIVEARELLASAVHAFPGNIEMKRAGLAALVMNICGEAVATALQDAGTGEGQQRGSHEVVVMLIDVVGKFANPYLAMRCLPIAFGMPSDDESETDLAAEFGVTKAAVSNICVTLCERFGVPPGRGMKSVKSRSSYADRQIGKRARPLPKPWPHRGILAGRRAA